MLHPRSTTLAALSGALLLALASCGGGGNDELQAPRAPETCSPKLADGIPDDGLVASHARARELGEVLGRKHSIEYVQRRTRDGYRLRRLISTIIMGVSLFVVGALLGTLLLGLLAKRPQQRYAQRMEDTVDREVAAIRALGPRGGDGPVDTLLARFDAPLDQAERQAERLTDLATPLEHRPDDALARGELEGLYSDLEGLAGIVERLHLQVVRWAEHAAAADADLEALDTEIEAALAGLAERTEAAA